MKLTRRAVATAALYSLAFVPWNYGSVSFVSGTSHVSANSQAYPDAVTVTPPDLTLGSGSGYHFAEAIATNSYGSARSFVYTTVATNVVGKTLYIEGSNSVTRAPPYNWSGTNSASGSLVFSEDELEPLLAKFLFTGSAGQASVTVKNSLNQVVMSQSSSNKADVTFWLSPDTYTMTWLYSGFPVGSTSGGTVWH